MTILRLLAIASVALVATGPCFAADMRHCAGVIYVAVASSGGVSIDGKAVDPLKINETFATLRPSSKFIMYSRENASDEPQGDDQTRIRRVMDAMMRLRLPISLSTKADYSDSVDQDGNSHPRISCPV